MFGITSKPIHTSKLSFIHEQRSPSLLNRTTCREIKEVLSAAVRRSPFGNLRRGGWGPTARSLKEELSPHYVVEDDFVTIFMSTHLLQQIL